METGTLIYTAPGVIDIPLAQALFNSILNLPKKDLGKSQLGCLLVQNNNEINVRILGKPENYKETLKLTQSVTNRFATLKIETEGKIIVFHGFHRDINDAFEALYYLGIQNPQEGYRRLIEADTKKMKEDNPYLDMQKYDLVEEIITWLEKRESLLKRYCDLKKNLEDCKGLYTPDQQLLEFFEF